MEGHIQYMAKSSNLETEKAFIIDFPIDHVQGIEGLRSKNVKPEERKVTLEEITSPNKWNLDVHGFCILRAITKVDPNEVYSNREEFQKAYWYEIEALLHDRFPRYSRIEAFDLTVRKREPEYPLKVRAYNLEAENPAGAAHADYSHSGGFLILQNCFPGQGAYWKNKDFDLINVWRPLRGPTDDWPLAMCDFTTIDTENDLLLTDSIRRDDVAEISLMHYNKSHRWHYLKNQGVDDLFVFRNTDSSGKRARGFHAAVRNPNAVGPPRESLEVRLVAFY
ncbi:putative CmcJ-like methyltransferase [Bombardia bombarda]|uniref:CmcJ-like methyltransferase n=1 Tax=Bombardia bombarda TaxID=252184 RepID=A0AA39TW17_9PEZI|nr:putative CmcJ-like methyltransferase [Bombardia bombarda]